MRILFLSDLHLEFHRDGGQSFVRSLPLDKVDVVVLAGDIVPLQSRFMPSLDLFTKRAKHIVWVNGNHEYYGTSPHAAHKVFSEYVGRNPNLHWLNNSDVVIEGQRFLGGTLWFPHSQAVDTHRAFLNDFRVIRDFKPWVFEECEKTKTYLRQETRQGDIVVVHHLPSHMSVHPRFAGNPYNVFFVCDIEDIIRSTKPRILVHGHTHDSCQYMLGKTKVICNPFGYAAQEENAAFNSNLIFEV